MRHAAVLLFLLAGCSSLDDEQRTRLASHQAQAKIYYEGGDYGRALDQVERGLELAPDDYGLLSMKGGILLLRSSNASGTDHKLLDQATELLQRQLDERSLARHEPHLLLNHARAQQKQGLRHLGESIRLDGQATRAPVAEAGAFRQKAAAERELANHHLDEATRVLDAMVERGELLRIVHNHRLQIAMQRGDDKSFEAAVKSYLDLSAQAIDVTQKRIAEAKNVDYENEQMRVRRELLDEEREVRNLIAEFHFARKNFKDARLQLDKVIELDPRRFADYYNRGRVLLELGLVEEAKADFRRFLADPSMPASNDKAVFALKVVDR
jgi:tetratricopeptide (TPR) repeat protein